LRFLDISAALLIAVSSITALVVWNPSSLASNSSRYASEASLRDYLTRIVSSLGVVYLQNSSPEDLCSSLLLFSNSTVRVSALGPTFECSTLPAEGSPSAELELEFAKGSLTLLAWQPKGP